eukprot:5935537-Pyramimonas_sp.AAC.2
MATGDRLKETQHCERLLALGQQLRVEFPVVAAAIPGEVHHRATFLALHIAIYSLDVSNLPAQERPGAAVHPNVAPQLLQLVVELPP